MKEDSGSSAVVVRVNDKTSYRKQAAGAVSDIKKGDRLILRGDVGTEGSLNATSVQATTIQIVPADGFGADTPAAGANRQQAQKPASGGGMGSGGGAGPGGSQGAGMIMGVVDSVDGNTLEVSRQGMAAAQKSAQNGPTKVIVSEKTTIVKMVDGSLRDVKEGAYVAVRGPRGADGVIVASNVQLLPEGASQMRGRQQP